MAGPTVLIVESDLSAATLVAKIIQVKSPANRVLLADNGQDGLLLAQREHPALIIADLELRGLNGYEMVQRVRQERDGHNTLVIGMSGSLPNTELAIAFWQLCDDFLAKPFQASQLWDKLELMLVRINSLNSQAEQ